MRLDIKRPAVNEAFTGFYWLQGSVNYPDRKQFAFAYLYLVSIMVPIS